MCARAPRARSAASSGHHEVSRPREKLNNFQKMEGVPELILWNPAFPSTQPTNVPSDTKVNSQSCCCPLGVSRGIIKLLFGKLSSEQNNSIALISYARVYSSPITESRVPSTHTSRPFHSILPKIYYLHFFKSD